MTRRRTARLLLHTTVVGLVLLPAALLPVGGAAHAAGGRRWLALGDSYSSGEGIPGTTQDTTPQGENCQRATGSLRAGVRSDATAWAVAAYDSVRDRTGLDSLDFVACTGAITDDWQQQVEEAASGGFSWDVVSFSFGGNNIRFADVISGCLDVANAWDFFFSFDPGCDVDLATLEERIDMLAATRPLTSDYAGTVTLPDLYDDVARLVRPGGQVIVAGYPQLIEDPARWPAFNKRLGACRSIYADDAAMLRKAGTYLDDAIRRAVADADRRWANKGVTFTFADLSTRVYETGGGTTQRHGLCTTDEWLNGVTLSITSGDLRKNRSFHPTQTGHTNTGLYVATLVQLAQDAPGDGRYLYDLTSGQDAVGPTGTRRSFQQGAENSANSTSFWVGCEGRPAVTTFTVPARARSLVGTLRLDPQIAPEPLRVTVRILADDRPLGRWVLSSTSAEELRLGLGSARTLRLEAERTAGTCTVEDIGYGIVVDGALTGSG